MHKILNKINMLQNTPQKQGGAVLLIMLVILIMGASAMLLNSLNSTTTRLARDKVTADALLQAKEALIGFAVTYGNTHSGYHGFFPCPDPGGLSSEGVMDSICGTKNISQIGRFPWKELNLPPLRDSTGECLWYAVSGTYKYSPMTDLMNWDNYGQLLGYASDGTQFTAAENKVVAVIFAPGNPLAGQNRSGSGNPVCGGNYTVANYLDNDTLHTINNADISAGKYIQPHEHRDVNGNVTLTVNDQMLFITQNDIFNAIKKRNNFDVFVTSLINTAAACTSPPITVKFDNPLPNTLSESAGVTVGSLITGRTPRTCLTSSSPYENWQDNLLYARCSSGTPCLKVNSAIINCTGVVIFSGERNSAQSRITDAQKNIWSNYLEDAPNANLTAFNSGNTVFTGAISYSASSPSTDILKCIP